MEYHGKLYGRVGNNSYFPLGNTTEDFHNLEKSVKEANEFIKDVAELLGIDSDGIGYDGLTLSIDDFKEAINKLTDSKKI